MWIIINRYCQVNLRLKYINFLLINDFLLQYCYLINSFPACLNICSKCDVFLLDFLMQILFNSEQENIRSLPILFKKKKRVKISFEITLGLLNSNRCFLVFNLIRVVDIFIASQKQTATILSAAASIAQQSAPSPKKKKK